MTIDGYTQPGSSANTQPVGQGLNTVLRIEINGLAVLGTAASRLDAGDTTLKGLAIINRCAQSDRARRLPGLEHAHRGQLPRHGSGRHAALHQRVHQPGERSRSDRDHVVGGTTPAARNLISICTVGRLARRGSGHTARKETSSRLNATGAAAASRRAAAAALVCVHRERLEQPHRRNGRRRRQCLRRGEQHHQRRRNREHRAGQPRRHQRRRRLHVGEQPQRHRRRRHEQRRSAARPANAGNVVAGAHFGSGIEVQGTGHVVAGQLGRHRQDRDDRPRQRPWRNRRRRDRHHDRRRRARRGQRHRLQRRLLLGQRRRPRRRERPGDPIRGNRIYANKLAGPQQGLGIDLIDVGLNGGISANDAGDADCRRQRPAELSHRHLRVRHAGAGLPRQHALVDLRPRLLRQSRLRRPAERLPDGADLPRSRPRSRTDGNGHAAFTATLPTAIPAGGRVTATATSAGGAPRSSRRASPSRSTRATASPSGEGDPLHHHRNDVRARRDRHRRRRAGLERHRQRPDLHHGDHAAAAARHGSTTSSSPTRAASTGTLENGWVTFYTRHRPVHLQRREPRAQRRHGRHRAGRVRARTIRPCARRWRSSS